MPTLQNDVVYIPKVDKMQCKLLFDLKFSIATDNEQPCQNVSLPPKSAESVCADDKKCLTQKSRMYHEPPLETDIDSLGWKKFARETDKKIRWVLKMYHQWREERNKHPDLIHIWADLDHVACLQKSTLCYGLCRFITEICKINGSDFPPKTIYKMIVCIQMFLETKGLFWKLLDDKEFSQLHYTCDNIMKE